MRILRHWNILINGGMFMNELRMTFTKLSTSDLLCDNSQKAWGLKVIQRDFSLWITVKFVSVFTIVWHSRKKKKLMSHWIDIIMFCNAHMHTNLSIIENISCLRMDFSWVSTANEWDIKLSTTFVSTSGHVIFCL